MYIFNHNKGNNLKGINIQFKYYIYFKDSNKQD